jgi:hypothetical protein
MPRRFMSGNPSTLRKWASVTVLTLVMVGGASPAFFHNGTQTLVDILPNAKSSTLAGQDHGPADSIQALARRKPLGFNPGG